MRSSEHARPGRRVQLHRALSKLGWGSRTQAWAWVRAGEVCVDGRVATDPLEWVDLERQRITRRGRQPAAVAPLSLALHKPRGIVTTRRDERGRRTVYDLLPPELPWVFPAGRLDADSEGLLILTNDAGLAARLTAPEHEVAKTYHVTVRGVPAAPTLEQLRQGVELSDGRTRPARVRILETGGETTVVEMVLTEGRNRQIRRMWSAVGSRVRRLVRVGIGAYRLGDLPPGACRTLGRADVRRLTAKGSGQP
ncbi:MAG TPA: pseudouridine synthase [Gemmataceae bacterium]|jgi:23S rRNA pseudouridine2605 synthase|nr:pseudouridine synthase [Gemmataceae bacterium]